jgi:integrase
LVGLDRQDVEITHQGQVVHIRRSKTDQFGAGRKIGTLLVGGGHRPVAALEEWLTVAAISDGAIFRRVDRHRNIHPKRISAEAVALIVKERAAATGLNAEVYSGHSLRAGFATSAATAGMPTWKIRQQTGHASDTMLGRYIRNANTFTDVFEEGAVT